MIVTTFITSRQNRLFKEWLSVKKRKQRGFCLLEGERLVSELSRAEKYFAALTALVVSMDFFETKQLFLSDLLKAINEQNDQQILANSKLQVYVLADFLYSELANTVQSQGIIALLDLNLLGSLQANVLQAQQFPSEQQRILKQKKTKVLEWQTKCAANNRELVLVLDQVQDPGNLGNIIRTAAAFGVDCIYSLTGTVHAWQDKVLRSTMGGIFKLPIIENCEAEPLLAALKEASYSLLAASLSEQEMFTYLANNTSFSMPKVALIVGNEGNGVSLNCLEKADAILTIPMLKDSESLNVATATAICLAELRFH